MLHFYTPKNVYNSEPDLNLAISASEWRMISDLTVEDWHILLVKRGERKPMFIAGEISENNY